MHQGQRENKSKSFSLEKKKGKKKAEMVLTASGPKWVKSKLNFFFKQYSGK